MNSEDMNFPLILRQARNAVADQKYEEAALLYTSVMSHPDMADNFDIKVRHAFCVEKTGSINQAIKLYQGIVKHYHEVGEEGAAKGVEQTIAQLEQVVNEQKAKVVAEKAEQLAKQKEAEEQEKARKLAEIAAAKARAEQEAKAKAAAEKEIAEQKARDKAAAEKEIAELKAKAKAAAEEEIRQLAKARAEKQEKAEASKAAQATAKQEASAVSENEKEALILEELPQHVSKAIAERDDKAAQAPSLLLSTLKMKPFAAGKTKPGMKKPVEKHIATIQMEPFNPDD